MRLPLFRAAVVLAAAAVSMPAPVAASTRPDKIVVHTFDLSRSADKPLTLVLKLPEGMWQFGDRRVLGRIESRAHLATSWLFNQDTAANGWQAQGYLAIHDLRTPRKPLPQRSGHLAQHKGKRRRSRKRAPQAFREYLATLPARYASEGYRIAVPPHTPHAAKDLRAGRRRVELWYTDLGITRESTDQSVHEYRESVYGFVANDWLVTLRVRQLAKDLASQFLDGISLSVRRAKASRDVKFTAVTTKHLETRSTFRIPKGYVRRAPGKPASAPNHQMAIWERFDGEKRVGRLTFDVVDTAFDPARDVVAWQARHPWSEETLEVRPARSRRRAHAYAYGETKLDGQPAASHAVIWHEDQHRYVLRLDVVLGPSDTAKSRGRREIDALLGTLRSWATRRSSSR